MFRRDSPETANTPSKDLRLADFLRRALSGTIPRSHQGYRSHHHPPLGFLHQRASPQQSGSPPETKPSHAQVTNRKNRQPKPRTATKNAETVHRRLKPDVYL
ncbi:hypothetical protein Rs2_42925 [Raphanus sativus]|nr:hypothetical protein Rs2_42925 [Raphanus sativus]